MDGMKRSWTAAALACVALAGSACAATGLDRGGSSPPLPEPPRTEAAPAVLVLMPDSAAVREAFRGLVEELGAAANVSYRWIEEGTSVEDVSGWMATIRPRAVVLMNNTSLRLYRRYQSAAPRGAAAVPAVAVLTSFLRESSRGLAQFGGVIYEVPLLTSVVNLRALVEKPIRRVGVLHRPVFSGFLEEQTKLAAPEGVEIVAIPVEEPTPSLIRKGINQLKGDTPVDAIWVLNDNRMLTPDLIRRGWVPALENNDIPVLVNIRTLLSRRVDFGTFAVLPDHYGLGVQVGQMLGAAASRGWVFPAGSRFEYPIAVRKVLHLEFARAHLALVERELETVDEVVD